MRKIVDALLMDKYAITYKRFFTQEEYEKAYGLINIVNNNINNLYENNRRNKTKGADS